ncbi:MAG: hypothetical protein ACKVP3_23740 [Hyphomicrobiaceae bacterium]
MSDILKGIGFTEAVLLHPPGKDPMQTEEAVKVPTDAVVKQLGTGLVVIHPDRPVVVLPDFDPNRQSHLCEGLADTDWDK